MESDQMEEAEGKPRIGKWKFIVVVSAFCVMTLINIPLVSFGIIYSHLLMGNEVSSTSVAWIFNIAVFMWHLSGIFAGPLCDSFGHRKVAVCAGFVLSTSILASGFLEEARLLFLYFSILAGFSCGTLMAVCNFIVPVYFEVKKGTAVGVMYLGISTSFFIGPPIVYYLQQLFGEGSAIYIFGALMFNTCAASMTFHPVEWHTKKPKNKSGEGHGAVAGHALNQQLGENISDRKSSQPCTVLGRASEVVQLMKMVSNSVLENAAMIRSFRVVTISFSTALSIACELNFVMNFPFVLIERGTTMDRISWYLSISGISNAIFRVLLSLLMDITPFSSKWYCIFGTVITAASILIPSLFEEEAWIILSMVLTGAASSVLTVLPLVIIEFVGIEYFSGAYGVWGLVNAGVSLVVGPLLGVIKDATNNYNLCLQFLSIVALSGASLWLFMSTAVAYDKKRNRLPKILG